MADKLDLYLYNDIDVLIRAQEFLLKDAKKRKASDYVINVDEDILTCLKAIKSIQIQLTQN